MTTLLAPTTITTAVGNITSSTLQFRRGVPRNLTLEGIFTYGSGGTTIDAYVQTSIDGGSTWVDIANFHFTTASAKAIYNLSSLTPKTTIVAPTDGSLTGNTSVDGIIGTQLRVKYSSTGTYAASTTVAIYATSSDLTS